MLGPCDPERAMPTTMATIAAMPAAITISLNQPIPRTLKKPISDNNDETEARTIKAPPITATSKRPSTVSST